MKNYFIPTFVLSILIGFGSMNLNAQFDDLYYDPETDEDFAYRSIQVDDNYQEYDEYAYDDEQYDNADEYDYYYSSRIRRFRRSSMRVGFYNPFYTDIAFYDPHFNS